jgi:transposase
MGSYLKTLVDIPDDKGVNVKSAGKKSEKYVYKYTQHYRNENKECRHKEIMIGKYDTGSGRMFPNARYFELYNVEPLPPDFTVLDYGYSYLALKAAIDTGAFDCLCQAFGGRAMDIVVMAAYIIREGNAMDGIEEWLPRNYFPGYRRFLSSNSTSDVFASLTDHHRNGFFKLWVKKALGSGTVCYDVTSISSYAQEMPDIEHGYNRDGDDLAQFNLGMFCNELTKLPIYYNRYNGSLTDKTNLSYALANAKALGIKKVKLIADGGFWSEECIASLHKCCDAFILGMPQCLKESEKAIGSCRGAIEKYSNSLSGHRHIYCLALETTIYDAHGRVMVYYDSWNHVNLCKELSANIDRLKAELKSLKKHPASKLKRYNRYFDITKHDKGSGFDFEVNFSKIEELRSNKGYFLIFTTDMESTPDEILWHYRAKDADEKIFSQIKVDMDGSRIRTHNQETTDGKTFVTFIACLIRTYMMCKLSEYLADNSTSMKKVFSQLSNITIIRSDGQFRLTKALTKKQKQILSAFNAENEIIDSIRV